MTDTMMPGMMTGTTGTTGMTGMMGTTGMMNTMGMMPTTTTTMGFGCCDIIETPNCYMMKMDCPSCMPKDLCVDVQDNCLTIKCERRKDMEMTSGMKYHRMERPCGTCTRCFRLPADVDETKITADHTNGCLTITCPKTSQPRSRKNLVAIRTTAGAA